MKNNLNKNDDLMPASFEERDALEKKRYKLAKKQDLFVILAILIVAAGLWIYSSLQGRGQVLYAEINYMNEVIDRVKLEAGQERVFSYPEDPDVVFKLNMDGSIQFDNSDCPDQICVDAGSIHRHDAFIACVPNGFLVSIQAEDSHHSHEEVDIVN